MIELNLLPPAEKRILELEQIQRWILFYASAILMILIIFVGLLAGIWSFLLVQHKSLASNLKSIQSNTAWGQTLIEQRESIKKINQELEQINRIQKNHQYYSRLLIGLADLIPEGVRLESISVDKQGQMALYGFAPRRDQVIALKQNLEQSKFFENVESPLSNLTKQEAINFYFKLKLKPTILIKS